MTAVLFVLLVTASLALSGPYNGTKFNNICSFNSGLSSIYRESVANIGKDLWDSIEEVPVKKRCLKDFKKFLLEGLENADLWALKMLDSSAKFPSGVLSGNVNQLGDFDECLSIKIPISGKYCLASLDLDAQNLGFSKDVESLMHSHHFIKSNMTDIGHRLPRTSTIYWGVCLPSSCSADDLEKILIHKLNDSRISVMVEDKNCVIDEKPQGNGKNYAITFFAILLGLSIVSPKILEAFKGRENSPILKALESFSLEKNISKFLDLNSRDEARGIDGIRALNALGLLLGHKSVALFFSPYVNRTYMSEKLGHPWAIVGRTAIIYTDSFMLISGYLTARTLFKDLNRKGDFSFGKKFFNRLFRILPTLFCIIIFCTFILPEIGSGPMWDMVVTEHSRLCKKNMWKSFLFIHNYMGFENMCLTHTHQLGIDMQLFLIAPLITIFIWKEERNGVLFSISAMILSTILRFVVTIQKNISTVIYFGMSVKTFFDTANFSYILPTHRATIYLMGVLLANFMSQEKSRVKLNKLQIFFCWTIFLTMGLLAMVGPVHMGLIGYEYNNIEAAIYTAFSPIVWGLFIAWTIWACSNECAGWFGDFLAWRGFKMFTKISLGVYLTQFPLFFYNVGKQRNSGFYSLDMMFDLYEIITIVILSSLLAIFVEIPFNNIAKWILDDKKPKIKCEENNNKDTGINNYNENLCDKMK